MQTTDIIRSVLDLIDQLEQPATASLVVVDDEPNDEQELSRFKQIFAMLSNPGQGPLANSPNEVVAPVDAVTTLAGGGLNGPKHPADIRIKDPRGYE